MKYTPQHTLWRMIATTLRDRGYSIYAGALYVPAPNTENINDDQPDILALHKTEPAMRVYIRSNQTSGIWKNTQAGGTLVRTEGVEDLISILTTGRPLPKEGDGKLFS